MKKWIFLFTALTILSTLLASCQPQIVEKEVVVTQIVEVEKEKEVVVTQVVTQEVEKIVEVQPERINIVYWIFGSEGSAMGGTGELWSDWYTRIFNEYEAAHPGVDIDFALRGYDASGSTLFIDAAVAAGTPPDIYFDTKFRVKKYYDEGLLVDLAPVLSADEIAAYDAAVFAGSYDGDVIWSIPASGGYWNYIVNTTAFEKAGLSDMLPKAPDFSWTTEEFMTACEAINDPPNMYCTAFFAGSPSMDSATNQWLAGFPDCKFFDQESKQYTVNSPACLEAFTFLHGIYDKGLMVPGAAGHIDDTIDPYWLNGEVAMLGQGNWYDKITKRGISEGTIEPFEYINVQFPNKPGAPITPVGMADPDVWGVFKQDDPAKQQAIFDLIHYMQQPEIVTQIAVGWGKIPVRTDAPFKSDDPSVSAWIEAARTFGAYNSYFNDGVPCNFNEVRQAWAEARQEFWQDGADIQAILDAFVERANGIIAECE